MEKESPESHSLGVDSSQVARIERKGKPRVCRAIQGCEPMTNRITRGPVQPNDFPTGLLLVNEFWLNYARWVLKRVDHSARTDLDFGA